MLILIRPFCHNSISALFCQSFYNSSTRPVWTLWAKPITLFFSLSLPLSPDFPATHTHPYTCAHKHKTCDPTHWSITDGGLAIAIPTAIDSSSHLAPPFCHHSNFATTTSRYVIKSRSLFFKQAPHLCPQTQGVFLKEWWKKKGFGTCEVMFKKNFIA